MYNDNLTIDMSKKNIIPQNEDIFFSFEKSFFLKNSLEIMINPNQTINTLNLFICIKSLTCSLIYIPHIILIIIKKKDSNFIAHSIEINLFKSMSYIKFLDWFYKNLNNDKVYIDENTIYSFVFTYPIDIFDRNLIEYIRPIYPWRSNIFEKILKDIQSENNYIEIIKNQQKKIEKLENEIKNSGNRV